MNSNSNLDKTSMQGYKEGMRGVDREDNPMEVPATSKSWTEQARETLGFNSSSTTQSNAESMGEQAKSMGQTAQSKADSALDDMKQTMDSTETGSKVHNRGNEIINEINKEMQGKDIGGSQLFGNPKDAKEGAAGQGFLTKYANESAPGENTA